MITLLNAGFSSVVPDLPPRTSELAGNPRPVRYAAIASASGTT